MLICEKLFNEPDPERMKFSMEEVDYGWACNVPGGPRYLRSLRKNLDRGVFELVRHGATDGSPDVVLYEGDFRGALRAANRLYGYHDEECPHIPKRHAVGCPGMSA